MNPRTARSLSAAALVAAPLLMAVATTVDLTPDADSTGELLGLIDERPGAWSTTLLLFFLSGLLWIPAGLALWRAFGAGRPLGRAGAAAVLLGGAALIPLDAASLYLRPLATSAVPLDQQIAVVDAVEGSAALMVAEVVHVVGLFAGLLVVALGLIRSRIVPLWTPVVLLVALAGLLAAPHRVVETAALALLVVAFVGLAARTLGAGREGTREPAAVPVAS